MEIPWRLFMAAALLGVCMAASLPGNGQQSLGSKMEFAKNYLTMYGFMGKSQGKAKDTDMAVFIKSFQKMFKLAETGLLDKDTLQLMDTPRCANKDVYPESSRKKRRANKQGFTTGPKWPITDLTYRIKNLTPDITNSAETTQVIDDSFKVWEAASTLKFTKTTSDTHDIDVRFGSDSGSSTHLDDDLTSYIDNNVEGRFGRSTLAHAFFPFAPTANTYPNKFSGDAHFNEDVTWIKPGCGGGGTDLRAVAIHEFGHSLGLGHSNSRDAIMYPYYTGCKENVGLGSDDIAGIQSLYGAPVDGSTTTTTPNTGTTTTTLTTTTVPTTTTTTADPGTVPNICTDSTFDAAFKKRNSELYLFKGNYVWVLSRIYSRRRNVKSGYPKLISADFPGITGPISAATYIQYRQRRRRWSEVTIIKGDQVYIYDSSATPATLKAGYPKSLGAQWKNLPDSMKTGVDALMMAPLRWRNYPLMFTKGGRYWLEGGTSTRTGTLFRRGLNLGTIDASLVRSRSYFMFLKGDTTYFYHVRRGVRYRTSNANYWLRNYCSSSSMAGMEGGPEDIGAEEEAGAWDGVVLDGNVVKVEETLKEPAGEFIAQMVDEADMFPFGNVDGTSGGSTVAASTTLLFLIIAFML